MKNKEMGRVADNIYSRNFDMHLRNILDTYNNGVPVNLKLINGDNLVIPLARVNDSVFMEIDFWVILINYHLVRNRLNLTKDTKLLFREVAATLRLPILKHTDGFDASNSEKDYIEINKMIESRLFDAFVANCTSDEEAQKHENEEISETERSIFANSSSSLSNKLPFHQLDKPEGMLNSRVYNTPEYSDFGPYSSNWSFSSNPIFPSDTDMKPGLQKGPEDTPEYPEYITRSSRNSTNSSRPFICAHRDCNRAFKRFEHLKRHYRIHTGERPYRCKYPGCEKTFARSDNLNQHIKIHGSNQPYISNKNFKYTHNF